MDVGGKLSPPIHPNRNGWKPPDDGLPVRKNCAPGANPEGMPVRCPHMRPWTGMSALHSRHFLLSRALMIFVIPDGIGDADTDIPHLWFLGAPHPAAECPPFLRMLDLRHIRLITAQVSRSVQIHWFCHLFFLHLKKMNSGRWIVPPNKAGYCALISSERWASWHSSITNPALINPLIRLEIVL